MDMKPSRFAMCTGMITLSAATNAFIAQGVVIGTILNDDPLPTLSVLSASANEQQSGTWVAAFVVRLNTPSGVPWRASPAESSTSCSTAPR